MIAIAPLIRGRPMSDEGITPTPRPPRCTVCDGATATTPGAVCPACGVSFEAASPPALPDVRRRESSAWFGGYDQPVYAALGLLVCAVVCHIAVAAPGILVILAILLVPAGIRAVRIATRPEASETRSFGLYMLGAIVASLGVALLAGTAAAVAAGAICWAVAAGGGGLNALGFGLLIGGFVGLCLFGVIYAKLWPRESAYDKIRRPPDPED
jgi:hypothetical protein